MSFKRDEASSVSLQNERIERLIREAVEGITKRDVLPNSAQPLQGEVEAAYFKKIRSFFRNSLSHKIMNYNQDIFGGK